MLAVLIAIRDVLVALALAWVGVSMEARSANEPSACAGEACDSQTDN
jgi:hypothetical protein